MLKSTKNTAIITILTIFMVLVSMLFMGSTVSHAESSADDTAGVVPAVDKPAISSLSCVISRSFTVKSKKNTDVEGYQICYSQNSSFSAGKTVSYTGNTLNKTVRKLKAGKTYYVKIRAFKTENGIKEYSDWSDSKSVKVYLGTVKYTTHATTKFYKKRSFSASSILVWYDTKVRIISTVKTTSKGKWQKVRIGNKAINYYRFTKKGTTDFTGTCAKTRTYTKSTYSDYQNDVVKKALSYLKYKTAYDFKKKESDGVKRNGKYTFHCSGFATYVENYVMKEDAPPYKISANMAELWGTGSILNEGLAGQMKAVKVCGSKLDKSKLQAGDIVFFKMSKKNIDHCGIYLGNGNFIQSTKTCKGTYSEKGKNTTGGVCVAPLSDFYKRTFVGAKRYLPKKVTAANIEMTTSRTKYTTLHNKRECDGGRQIPQGADVTLLFTYKIGNNLNAYVQYENTAGYVYRYKERLNRK